MFKVTESIPFTANNEVISTLEMESSTKVRYENYGA